MMPPKDSAEISFGKVGPPTGSNATRAPRPFVIRITSPTRSVSSVAMTCAAPASRSCWLLRRGAGQRDGRRTRIVGDLDRRDANATGRRRDENEVALGDLRVLDERAIGGHEHHPD